MTRTSILIVALLLGVSSAASKSFRGTRPRAVHSRHLQELPGGQVQANGRLVVVGAMPTHTASKHPPSSHAPKHFWLELVDTLEHIRLSFHSEVIPATQQRLHSGQQVKLSGVLVTPTASTVSDVQTHPRQRLLRGSSSILGRGAGVAGSGSSKSRRLAHAIQARQATPQGSAPFLAFAERHIEVHSLSQLFGDELPGAGNAAIAAPNPSDGSGSGSSAGSAAANAEARADRTHSSGSSSSTYLQEANSTARGGILVTGSSPLALTTLDSGPTRAWGTPKILVVAVAWCGAAPHVTENTITSGWFPRLARWSTSCSFNRTLLLASNIRVQVLELCFPLASACPYLDLASQAEPLLAALLGPRVLQRFNHTVYITPREFECAENNLSGAGLMPGKVAWLDRLYWDDIPTLAHELGHNWGLEHSWQGGQEYLDWSDIMGNAHQALCMNAPHAWQLQWATPLATVSSYQLVAGTRQTYQLPAQMDSPSNMLRILLHNVQGSSQAALKPSWGGSASLPAAGSSVPDPSSTSYQQLWVSYMVAKGGSRELGPAYSSKVNIWRWDGQLPGSSIATSHLAAVDLGGSWTDPNSKIQITFLDPTANSSTDEFGEDAYDALDETSSEAVWVQVAWAPGVTPSVLSCSKLHDCDECDDDYVNAACNSTCAQCAAHSCKDVDTGCASILNVDPSSCSPTSAYYSWMLANCRKSCNLCQALPSGCRDAMEGCDYLVKTLPESCFPDSDRYEIMTRYCKCYVLSLQPFLHIVRLV